MKSQEPHNRDRMERADPKALATARELALLIPNDAVMLFGSRARGDHRPDSDIDLLLLNGTGKKGNKQPCLQTRLQEAGNQAAARIYGQDPHPEVQVVAMHPGTYQRTKHSRNFLAGHIATDMVLAEGDPQRWNRNPGDFSAEPIYARRNAVEALKATTVLNEWRVKYLDEEDDLVLKAQDALSKAHHAIASHAGLTIRREETIQSIRSRLRRQGLNLPKTLIQIQQYNWFDKPGKLNCPPMAYNHRIASTVRRDVEQVLAIDPALHRDAKARWNRWKKSRRNRN